MFRQPFFSIIIPALNEEKFLPLLLTDLKYQTYSNFEIIVVDGNSEDKTAFLARKFPKTFVEICEKRNIGFQRNLGAKRARGKYLIFNDADVRLPKYFLEGIKYRLSEKETDIFTSWAGPESDKPKDKAFFAVSNLGLESSKFLNSPIAYGAMMGCRKDIFDKIGGFNEKISYGEDSEFVQRAVKKDYRYEVFRDPQFSYSLRRYEKNGVLPSFRANLKYLEATLLNDYPEKEVPYYPLHGGKPYSKDESGGLGANLPKIASDLKKIKRRNKIEKFLEDLLN